MWKKPFKRIVVGVAYLLAWQCLNECCLADDSLNLELRSRVTSSEDKSVLVRQRTEAWQPSDTAVIVCDMWDLHHCYRAVQREKELAPKLDSLLRELRDRGVTIIHAPSACMDKYVSSEARRRAIETPAAAELPKDIDTWCHSIPAEAKGTYPIDQSDGGEDDSPEEHQRWVDQLAGMGKDPKQPWTQQIDQISIDQSKDYISDSGSEIWNILKHKGIQNVMLTGVHTNMCVLGRPFGLRQLAKNGVNVVLVRDMTDTMYNPAARPYVSHFTGTDLIVEHIERYVCPTITSNQIMGGKPFRFSGDRRPKIAIMVGEREYQTSQSLYKFAVERLGKDYRIEKITPNDKDRNRFENLDALADCDVLLLSVRRRTLPVEQLEKVKRFIHAGKPVIGLRTSSHAFALRAGNPKTGYAVWPGFDSEVFGGNYSNHYGNAMKCKVEFPTGLEAHPLLKGVSQDAFQAGGSLYQVSPIARSARVLMLGTVPGKDVEPVAWTYKRADGGRSFYTSLGHRDDFEQPAFQALLRNAVDWAASAVRTGT